MGAIVYCVGVKEFNQTQVGSIEGYRRCCKCIKKANTICFFFLRLYVFLACNYCRYCGTCVSCMGRLPSPQGNHWLGMTHTHYMSTHKNNHSQRDTQNHIRLLNCLFFFFSFCLISQIIKKSCIEILSAEPSSVCAGGREKQAYPFLVRMLGSHGVQLCKMTVI